MRKQTRKKQAQPSFSGKLLPRKPKNADVRPREYLTEPEIESLMDAAASQGRHGHRDAAMILLAFRHGLRVSELIALRWDMVDLDAGIVHVTRLKPPVSSNGTESWEVSGKGSSVSGLNVRFCSTESAHSIEI